MTLAGAVPVEDVPAFYAAADAFCLPSYAEGVPIVLMEAMASGLPVVATRIAGIPELVTDAESGLLVDPGDQRALAGALSRLARSPDLATALGARGARGRDAEVLPRGVGRAPRVVARRAHPPAGLSNRRAAWRPPVWLAPRHGMATPRGVEWNRYAG